MQQISLFSGLSSALNLKANLGVQIKAPVLASVNLSANAHAQSTTKTEAKSDIKADVKTEVKVDVKAPAQEKAPTPPKMVEPAYKETVKVQADVKAQAELKLKEIVTTPIKAEVKAHIDVKTVVPAKVEKIEKAEVKPYAQEKAEITPPKAYIQADVKAQVNAVIDLLKDIKLGAYSQKAQGWDADKYSQPHEDKGFEKTEKIEKLGEWKEGVSHKGGDTLDLSKLKINLEAHVKGEGHAYQAVHQENAWQGHETNQYAHTQAWDAHGEAHVELTGQVQHHGHVMHA